MVPPCFDNSLTNNANRKDPPLLAQGRVSSATVTAISNIRMLEPQAQWRPWETASPADWGPLRNVSP
jgi:hypothetical protein